jgi:hypothetical protein
MKIADQSEAEGQMKHEDRMELRNDKAQRQKAEIEAEDKAAAKATTA